MFVNVKEIHSLTDKRFAKIKKDGLRRLEFFVADWHFVCQWYKFFALTDILSVNGLNSALTDLLSVSELNSMPDRQKVCQWPHFHALTDLLSVSGLNSMPDRQKVCQWAKFHAWQTKSLSVATFSCIDIPFVCQWTKLGPLTDLFVCQWVKLWPLTDLLSVSGHEHTLHVQKCAR